MNPAFHPEAIREFEEAAKFYRARGRNLAIRFSREIQKTIARLVAHPDRWRILEHDIHRCLVNVFPYSVLYTIEPDYVLIVAIMHNKRQPGYWRSRLKKRDD
ncbi:MAG TPA: type II toxin-antitoxin system RelE/ParE family toxin [Verrucomicrobiae bacterium]|nr:type II toxin-antitoxin system RelE/ParE family toxin [Verrucomicrobiae bacterium]